MALNLHIRDNKLMSQMRGIPAEPVYTEVKGTGSLGFTSQLCYFPGPLGWAMLAPCPWVFT